MKEAAEGTRERYAVDGQRSGRAPVIVREAQSLCSLETGAERLDGVERARSMLVARRRGSGESAGAAVDEDLLLARCIDGDRTAWRSLHSQYYPVALSFLRRMGVPPEELEDASQDVFVRCFRSLPSFRGEASFKTWFYRICLSEANRWRRWRRLAVAVRNLWTNSGEFSAVTHQEFSSQTAVAHVQAALRRMPEGERAAFILYEFEGQTGKEVAEILRCPVATVWRRLHDARRAFRAQLLSAEEGRTEPSRA